MWVSQYLPQGWGWDRARVLHLGEWFKGWLGLGKKCYTISQDPFLISLSSGSNASSWEIKVGMPWSSSGSGCAPPLHLNCSYVNLTRPHLPPPPSLPWKKFSSSPWLVGANPASAEHPVQLFEPLTAFSLLHQLTCKFHWAMICYEIWLYVMIYAYFLNSEP